MTRLKTEQCIYARFNKDRSEHIILAVNVDGLVTSDTTQEATMTYKQQITANFECKDLKGGQFLSQSPYVKDVLEKFKQYLPAKGSTFNGA